MHKHAEVLKAIAEGKPIERLINGFGGNVWIVQENLTDFNPISNPDDSEWRVSPDKQMAKELRYVVTGEAGNEVKRFSDYIEALRYRDNIGCGDILYVEVKEVFTRLKG